jgi:hypothetical protein
MVTDCSRAKNGTLKDSLTVKSLGESIALDEQWQAIDRIHTAHGTDIRDVGTVFAKSIEQPVLELGLLQQAYWRRFGDWS